MDTQSYVSTGHLPREEDVAGAVREAWERYRALDDGENSQVYPALARVPRELFGVALVTADGRAHVEGDADVEFAIMSVSKPFVFALICEELGAEEARRRLGANPTGLPFNSLAAVERSADGRTNPMVNAGALATTSLIPGRAPADRWRFVHEGLSRFAGRTLSLNDEVCESALKTNDRNHALARLLHSVGALWGDPSQVTELYTRQCALDVSARDLAVMAATLGDGGVNPLTGEEVVSAAVCHHTLAVMLTAGMYETSGDWLYDVGLPGKSGIGGGILAVAPGKGGLGTFAPPLDTFGNSVKGQAAARFLSQRLGLDLLASAVKAPGAAH